MTVIFQLGSHCTSRWYVTNWEYYWGQWWHTIPQGAVTTVRVGTPHCGDWRANLAFSFISAWIWLISGIIVSGRSGNIVRVGRTVCTERSIAGHRGIDASQQEALGRTDRDGKTNQVGRREVRATKYYYIRISDLFHARLVGVTTPRRRRSREGFSARLPRCFPEWSSVT